MKTLKEQKWMLIVYAVALIAIGIVEFVLGIVDIYKAVQVVSYTVGSALMLIGLLHILGSLISDTKAFFKGALVLGSVFIAMGIVLIAVPTLIALFLIKFVAILAIALAAVFLAKAIIGIVYKYKGLWIFFYFLIFVLALLFGILALVYEQGFTQGIYCATGAFVFLVGILLLIVGIKVISNKKNEVPAIE